MSAGPPSAGEHSLPEDLQRAIADMQRAQREALDQLMRVARSRPKAEAEALADAIVANWTEAAVSMLLVRELDEIEPLGSVQ